MWHDFTAFVFAHPWLVAALLIVAIEALMMVFLVAVGSQGDRGEETELERQERIEIMVRADLASRGMRW